MFRKIFKFTASPVASGGSLVMHTTIEAGANAEWWQQLPWGDIALWALIFWVGTIWADLFSKNSDIKSLFRRATRRFEVSLLAVGGQMEPRARIVRAKIRFVKRIKRGHLYLRAYTNTGKKVAHRVQIIDLGELHNITPDTEKEIRLATEAIAYSGWKPTHSTIGPPDADAPISLIGSSRNIIEIELKAGLFCQKERICVETLNYGGKEYGAGLFALHEDEDLFAI